MSCPRGCDPIAVGTGPAARTAGARWSQRPSSSGLSMVWARKAVRSQWTEKARNQATEDTAQVTYALKSGRYPVGLVGRDSDYVAVSTDGRSAAAGGDLDLDADTGKPVWPGFAPAVS
ncbi:hypothetical protein ACIBI3_39575 [Actinomadura luteofluorescens]|uniref:hypothetical protein n=1 Tax=Actinomadura luteofluorescens TaxID=46163 RepID=UPI00346FDC73